MLHKMLHYQVLSKADVYPSSLTFPNSFCLPWHICVVFAAYKNLTFIAAFFSQTFSVFNSI